MKKVYALFAFCLIFLFGCGGGAELNVNKPSKNLNTYTMDLVYNSDKTLDALQTLSYTNKTDTSLKYLCFHLYVKAFSEGAVNKPITSTSEDKAYPNGPDFGDIVINNATINGKVTEFEYTGVDNNILKVALLNELEPMSKVKLKLEYKVYVPNIEHRFGYGENTINMGNFYPVLAVFENGDFVTDPYHASGDPFYSEVANYNVTLTVPENLVVASTGVQEKVTTQDEVSTYSIKAKAVRDFAFVMSENFTVTTGEVDGIKVLYYFYDDAEAENNLKAAIDSVKTFNNLFGKYPYETLSVVKTNFLHGGMEYPTLIYISDKEEGNDYINIIVHETAHQWWYAVVGNNEYKYSWLDEGLTEYSTALFYEENTEYGVNYTDLITNVNNSYVTFVDLYVEILGSLDTSLNRSLNEFNTDPEYVYMAYVKGMLLFEHLREVVGKEKFLKALQKYYKTYAFTNVTPSHLIGSFEKSCKVQLKSLINSWIDGKVVIIGLNEAS